MGNSSPKAAFHRDAPDDLWRRTLSRIPTLFGRLAYLASLRNPNTGVYEHFGLAQTFGDSAADTALRRSHEATFADWLAAPIRQKKADLDAYLSSLDVDLSRTVETWLRLAPHRAMPPGTARTSERDLFCEDFGALLEALRRENNLPVPDPDRD